MSYIYMEHPFLMFLDHTQQNTTVGRTPLDEWSAHRRDLYLTTHDTHNRQISMPPVGFKPTISAGERPAAAHLLRSWVRIPPGAWIFVCCECRVLSGRGLCDELITRPEESYRLWCVVCDLETSRMGAPYIYDISSLRFNPLNAKLKPICHLMALVGAYLIFHVSRIRVKEGWHPFTFPPCHNLIILVQIVLYTKCTVVCVM